MYRTRSNSVPSYLAPQSDVDDDWDNDDVVIETDDDDWNPSQLARATSLTATITYPSLSPVLSSFHLVEDYWHDNFIVEDADEDEHEDEDDEMYQSEESGTTKFDAVAAAAEEEDCFQYGQFICNDDGSSSRRSSIACREIDDSDEVNSMSSLSSINDEDEISIGIRCKRTKPLLSTTAAIKAMQTDIPLQQQQQQHDDDSKVLPKKAASTTTYSLTEPEREEEDDAFFEDIWNDSPSFHDYLRSMESRLYEFLAWVQKVEQCRQLEIAYSKSIALLYEQTKSVLTEAFVKIINDGSKVEDDSSAKWSTNNHIAESVELEEAAEHSKDVLSTMILALREHSGEIKTSLSKHKENIATARIKYSDTLSVYCAFIRKLKNPQASHKRLDDITIALYISKRVVCKACLEYIDTLAMFVSLTRDLLSEQLLPLLAGLKSMKYMNLMALDKVTIEATDVLQITGNNVIDTDFATEKSRSSSDILSSNSSSSSSSRGTGLNGFAKTSQSSLSTLTAYGCSVSDIRKLDNDRLSFYVQEKLATYYDSLRAYQTINDTQHSRSRTSSPNPILTLKSKSKSMGSSSLDSLNLMSRVSSCLIPIGCSQMTMKGYLFLKRHTRNDKIDLIKEQANAREEAWERHYFFITKEDGFLRQYYDEATSVIVANLKTVTVNISEAEKCDLLLQIVCQESSQIVTLQAETAIDYSNWIQALKSWNTNYHLSATKTKDSYHLNRSSSFEAARIPSLSSAMTLLSSKKSSLTTTNSNNNVTIQPPQQHKLEANFKKKSLDILSTRTNFRLSPTKFTRRSSSEALRKISNNDHHDIDLTLGHPVPITNCPIDCCNLTETAYDQIKTAQMTGVFKIHKTCVAKSICSSTDHHSTNEGLITLYVSLFDNGVIHLQTENNGRSSFFHRPIQLSKLSTRDLYSFPDSNEFLKHCFVLRPSSKEIYHIMANSNEERDTWVGRLKQKCATVATSYFGQEGSSELSPSPSTSGETLSAGVPGVTAAAAAAAVTTAGVNAHHRSVSNLTVRITEARHLALPNQSLRKDAKSGREFYCDVLLDDELRALTGCLKKAPSLFWGEEFSFTDIPKLERHIVINIYSRSEKSMNSSRRTIYGSVTVPAAQIQSAKKIQDEWFDILTNNDGLPQKAQILGQLRIGVLLEDYHVFPLHTYQPLLDVLTRDLDYHQHTMVYELARKAADVQQLAKNLLRIHEGMGNAVAWIKSLIDREVASLTSDDVNILFRGNSFFTRVIDNFMKSAGRNFLEEAIQSIIHKICQQHPPAIQLDTSRLSNNTAELNLSDCTVIFKGAQDIWTGIQRANFKCPSEIRRVFEYLQAAIINKFDLNKGKQGRQYQIAQYTCVSSFVFLRWICPAIISPKQFGLVQNQPDIKVGRLLTLIAKCLMTLASFSTVEQNTKEPWTICLSTFVQNNKYQFKSFINSISNAAEEQPAPTSTAVDEQLLSLASRPSKAKEEKEYIIDLPLELSKLTAWCTTINNTTALDRSSSTPLAAALPALQSYI